MGDVRDEGAAGALRLVQARGQQVEAVAELADLVAVADGDPGGEVALRDRLVYGTPDGVAKRLRELQEELGLSGVLMEPNVGGLIAPERLEHSIRLFGQEVAARLRA